MAAGATHRMFQLVFSPAAVSSVSSSSAPLVAPRPNHVPRPEKLVVTSAPRPSAPGPDPKTVLLVEDNEDNRIIYATALRYSGYDVLEAITGTEGVQTAQTKRPDLILMDISVPELDGWEATAILKADPETAHIPIIAVTAHALPGDEERSLRAGCDGYLAKPISPAMLVAEVDRRFGRTKPSYAPRG